jgi:O-antigen ligase
MKRLNKVLYNYVYFNAFPVIIIVQNLSVFFFPFLIMEFFKKKNLFFKKNNIIDYAVILFAIGAVLSVLSSINSPQEDSFTKGIAVLPNYIYWSLLILVFSYNAKNIDYQVVYKAVFWGVISTVVYFYTISDILGNNTILFKGLQQNIFSFIIICFAPMAVYFGKEKWGKPRAIVLAILLVLAGTLSGSRSGSVLTLVTTFLTLYSERLSIPRVIGIVSATLIGLVLLNLPIIKSTILQLNERTYNIIYEREETLATDQSYLVRLAQVEKGVGLFEENPYFGIGLNNFNSRHYDIEGDFEGFDQLKGVEELDQLSSHNSYVNVLAEGGVFLFVPFILMLISFFVYFIYNFKRIPDYQKPFFWGILGMSIHFYFIFAIVNVFSWMLMAFAASAIKRNSYNK